MLIYKIFGFADLLTVVIMFLLNSSLIPWRFALIFASYLIIKGLIFKGDFASMMDIIVGVYIILIPVFSWKILTIILAIYMIQKAVISFF